MEEGCGIFNRVLLWTLGGGNDLHLFSIKQRDDHIMVWRHIVVSSLVFKEGLYDAELVGLTESGFDLFAAVMRKRTRTQM